MRQVGIAAPNSAPAMPRATTSPATSCTVAETPVATAASSSVTRSVRTRPSRSETMPQTGCIAPYAM